MSTLRLVGTGVAWNTVATVAVKMLTLANVFLIINQLSVYNYGLLQLVLTVMSTVAGLMLPGLANVLMADLARERGAGNFDAAAAIARQYLILQIVLGVIAFVALMLGSSLIAGYLGRPEIGYFIAIAAISFLIAPIRGMLTVLTTIELRFIFQSVLPIIEEAAKLVLLLLYFFAFHRGIAGALYATVLAPLAVIIVVSPWARSLFLPLVYAPQSPEPWWRLLIGHRFWGVASSYLTTLNQNARLWFIQFFLGTEAVGLFSFAQGLASQAVGLVTFTPIVGPILAQATHEESRFAELANRAVKYHLWIALILFIPGLVITPFFIDFLFPGYRSAIPLVWIMLVVIIPSAINVAVSSVYAARQRQRQFFFRATLVRTLFVVLLSPILIPLLGIMGSALEFAITSSISVLERTRAIRTFVPGFMSSPRNLLMFDRTDRDLLERLWSHATLMFHARD